tara:strand:- start:278 stop:787 length:510 start_codon:yes stop_codon:yes gene_type:complete
MEKRDKLKKTIYLIELIKTKDELISLIEKHKGSPILLNKLNINLQEIEEDILSVKKRFRLGGFVTLISLEILVLFYGLSNLILDSAKQSGLLFFEGILESELSRVSLVFSIFLVSFFITFKVSQLIKHKIEHPFMFNLLVFVIYNLVLLILGATTKLFLSYTDKYLSWW